MSALRATACGFRTLVFARLPLPQRLDCTGAASGGREHREAADLPEGVLALLERHLLDLGGTYGDPSAGDPIRYDAPLPQGVPPVSWTWAHPSCWMRCRNQPKEGRT